MVERMDSKTTITATPEIVRTGRTSFEELQEDKSAARQKGGTLQDDRDMDRMGKAQQLRVSHLSLTLTVMRKLT